MTVIEQRSRKQIPPAIPAVAGIEMWERFSFYGMQAILAYYLYDQAGGLGIEQNHATALVGAYGAVLYLFTFVGGWVSDRVLGAERTLLVGAFLLMCGHVSLSLIPGFPGLFAGLFPLALGSGLLKTAAITVMGAAFPAEGNNSAFQIFYLGINVGAVAGPMLTGWLSTAYGYHAGFGAAAGLMLIGCVSYMLLRSRLLASISVDITRPSNPIAPKHLAAAAGGSVLAVSYTHLTLPTNREV